VQYPVGKSGEVLMPPRLIKIRHLALTRITDIRAKLC
jgi:hypothetical protein